MKLLVKKGKTSKRVFIFIQDSASTTGAGKTGLTSGSAGLVCYRARDDDGNAAGTQLTLSAGTRGTWSSGGFVEKDATNQPGLYELGLDNAGLVTGSDQVVYFVTGTGIATLPIEIQLVDFDPQDAVRMGMTALPSVASGSAGAIPTTGTGANQIQVDGAGNAFANVNKWLAGTIPAVSVTGVPKVDVADWLGSAPNALVQGKVDSLFNIRTGTAQAGAAGSITLDAGASATDNFYRGLRIDILAGTGAGQCRLVSGYTGSSKVATVAPNWTTNPDATSVFNLNAWGPVDLEQWVLGAPNALISGRVDSNAQASAATLTYNLTGNVSGSVGSVTGAVGSVTAGVTVTTNNDKTGYSLTQTFPANFSALLISGTGHISNVDTLTTYTGNTVQTGDAYARIGAAGAGLTAVALASSGLDSVSVEAGMNARQALSVAAAAAGGTVSGAATTTVTIAGANVGTNRITATVDASGNRSAVTLTLP